MYTYGATGMKKGPVSEGIRAGQILAPPPILVPDGDVHAVDEDGNAACGIEYELFPVHDPPMEWGTASFLDHCKACVAALKSR